MKLQAESKIVSLNEVTGIIDGQLDAEKFEAYQQYRENVINDVARQRDVADTMNTVSNMGAIASVTFTVAAFSAMIRAKSKAKASKAKTPTTEPADQ